MAAIKYELFFFFLSKLLPIGCFQNNPTGAAPFSNQNGMANSETWDSQQSISPGNNFNTYYSNQDPQYNELYSTNNQRQSDNELQYVVPRSIQPYDYQESYYQTTPPVTNTFQQPPVLSPQIAQPNSMLQHQSETLQPVQLNSNDGSFQHQQTTIYPNNGKNLKTDYNQQYTATPQQAQLQIQQPQLQIQQPQLETQQPQSQIQLLQSQTQQSQSQIQQPQSSQSYPPMQSVQTLTQSPVMYSETEGLQNQLNNDRNPSSTVPPSYDQIANTAGNKQMSQTSNPLPQPQVQKKTESHSSSVQLKSNPHSQSGPVLPSHIYSEPVGPQNQSQNKPIVELPNYDHIANTVGNNQYNKQMSPTTNPLLQSQIQQKTKPQSSSVQLQLNSQNEPVLPPHMYPEPVGPQNQFQIQSPIGPSDLKKNDNKPAQVSPSANPSTSLHQTNLSNHPTQPPSSASSSQPQFQSNSNPQSIQKPSSYQPQPPKLLGPLQPKVPEVQSMLSPPLQNKPNLQNLPQPPPASTNSNQLQTFSSQSQVGNSLTSLSEGNLSNDQNILKSNPQSDLLYDLNSINGKPNLINTWEDIENDANKLQPILVNDLNNDIQKPSDYSPPLYTNAIESNLEVKLENALAQTPTEPVSSNYKDSLENKDFNDNSVVNELARYDKSYSVDTEDPRSAMEDFDKLRVYANSNDIHLPNLPPILSKNTAGNKNNINLQNPPSSGVLNAQPLWPNSNINQQINPTPCQPQPVLPNKNQNQMFYSQMPISTTYNNNQLDPTLSNVGQAQMTSELLSNVNRPIPMDNSGYNYKEVDLQNPPSYSTSWSLLNINDPTRQRNRQQNYYSSNSQPSVLMPSMTSQNNNLQQGLLGLSLNDMFIQNMMTAISSAFQTPLYGTRAIFDVTQANFPNIPVIQQLSLTNSVVQSIALGLRKIWNRALNIFGQRVKRSFNPFDSISSVVFPSTTDVIQNLPPSGSLIKKDYNSAATSTMSNMNNQPYQPPAVDPYMMNAYNSPLISSSSPSAPFTSFTNSQPTMSQPTGYTLQQQQLQYGSGYGYGLTQNNIGVAQLNPATANLSPEYITDFLVNEIKITISSNLPPPYTMNSPEVIQYYQQLTAVIGIIFQNQINNILQGISPL